MKSINITITILAVTLFFTGLAFGNDDRRPIDNPEKEIAGKQQGSSEDADLDRIIEALTIVVEYRYWREDQEALQRALERRYDFRRHRERDPFAFKSKRLRELLQKDRLGKEKFDRTIDDIEDALKELKRHYYRNNSKLENK